MKKVVTFIGTVVNNKFVPRSKEAFLEHFKSLNNKEVEVRVKRRSQSRSLNQNNYYWGVLMDGISQETGHTAEEVHDEMRRKFLTEIIDKNFTRVYSTASLNTIEFEDYCEDVRRWASAFLGISLPLPNEVE